MKKHVFNFDSMDAFVAEARKGAAGSGTAWQAPRQSTGGSESFTKTASFDAAARLAITGWEDGRARMVRGVAAVASAPSIDRAPAMFFDVAGAYPVAALAAAGEPGCMVNFAPVSDRARPVIRIAVSGSVSYMYGADEIFAYGAALLGLVDSLESADFRVELTVIFPAKASGGESKLAMGVMIKRAEDGIDLDRAAFALAHASTLRRLVFGVMEANLPSSVWGGGYGVPRKPEHGLDGDDATVFLPGPQQFAAGSPALRSPVAAFEALLPAALELLRDRYAEFPALQFGGAIAA